MKKWNLDNVLWSIVGLAFVMMIIVGVNSCEETHKSELKQEIGFIIAKQYRGEIITVATGSGISSSGNLVLTTSNIHVPPKFDVVIRCEHGVIFTIDNSNLYSKVNEGDTVLIDYYEVLNESNETIDLDFVDANKFQ